jgi:hypothetical protein
MQLRAAGIGVLLLHGCAPPAQVHPPPKVAAHLELVVLGPSTDGRPALQLHATRGALTIIGIELQRSDGVLRAELSTDIPGELQIAFADSVPGQRVPLEPAPGMTQIRYQVRIAPLPSRTYRVRLGRVEVGANAVVLDRETQEVRIP